MIIEAQVDVDNRCFASTCARARASNAALITASTNVTRDGEESRRGKLVYDSAD